VRFSAFDGGAQSAVVRRVDGPQAASTGDGGRVIVKGTTIYSRTTQMMGRQHT